MACGHAANGHTRDGEPCCAICLSILPGATKVATEQPNLVGRFAYCIYGNHGKVPSSLTLAWFAYRPNDVSDDYYCGCFGWD